MREKLTKRLIDSLTPKAERFVVWDTVIPGFGIRIEASGRKTFLLKYRTLAGEQRKPALGTYGAITLEQARDLANETILKVRSGEDPGQQRRDAREAPTVGEVCRRYLDEHARPHKKPSSVYNDECNLNLHVLPRWSSRKVASISLEDVERMHREITAAGTPGAANRVLALVSKILNLCERWGLRPQHTNPCGLVARNKEHKIHHDLSEIQLARLAKIFREADENPTAIAALRLLIFTGCRRGEVLGLRWDEVDLEHRLLRLKDSKTGEKTVALNSAAIEVLEGLARVPGTPWVFPSPRAPRSPKDPPKHWVNLSKVWGRLRKEAALPEFRIHDHRHNNAAWGAAEGLTLVQIGKLLGHRVPATTARYADLADDPRRAAAEKVGAAISAAMKGGEE